PPSSTPLPYTTLFRSVGHKDPLATGDVDVLAVRAAGDRGIAGVGRPAQLVLEVGLRFLRVQGAAEKRLSAQDDRRGDGDGEEPVDRKSTRLNSSHGSI